MYNSFGRPCRKNQYRSPTTNICRLQIKYKGEIVEEEEHLLDDNNNFAESVWFYVSELYDD